MYVCMYINASDRKKMLIKSLDMLFKCVYDGVLFELVSTEKLWHLDFCILYKKNKNKSEQATSGLLCGVFAPLCMTLFLCV